MKHRKNKIKRQHGIIKGLKKFLEHNVSSLDSVEGIIPGKGAAAYLPTSLQSIAAPWGADPMSARYITGPTRKRLGNADLSTRGRSVAAVGVRPDDLRLLGPGVRARLAAP